jgi:hypothetical protein
MFDPSTAGVRTEFLQFGDRHLDALRRSNPDELLTDVRVPHTNATPDSSVGKW